MKITRSLCAIALVAVIAQPVHAFDLGGLFGSKSESQTQSDSAAGQLLNQGIDAVAGEGTSNIVNGNVNPLVAMAANRLGVPNSLLPQLQALYDTYLGSGEVTQSDVTARPGLESWLGNKPGLNAETFATALNGLFATSN